MNTLCFFWKTARNPPGFQHPAARKPEFQRFFRRKRKGQRGHTGLRQRVFFHCFLHPEYAAARPEADCFGQLDGPAPLLYKGAEQPDILFLGVPHRAHQAVQRRFQEQRIRLLEGFQRPDRFFFLHCVHCPRREPLGQQGLGVLQQDLRLLGEVGVRTGGLFAEAAAALALRSAGSAPWRSRFRA